MYDLLADLKGNNENAFGKLYIDYFKSVERFILNNKGTIQDAEDVFQDALVVLFEKLKTDNFELTASLKTYIMAISKYIWFNKLRDKNFVIEFTDTICEKLLDEIDTSIYNEKDLKDKLQTVLHKITKHCSGLIHDLFFNEKSMEDIKVEYGYANKHTAQQQKHKCLEQIRKIKEMELKMSINNN